MPTLPRPLDDRERLAALRRAALMDSAPEMDFDRISRLASRLLKAPVALLSLVDERRQFFKSALGLPPGRFAEARQTPLSHSFCQHVVTTGAPLVVDDARAHPVVCDNLAIPDLGVAAYLGIPVRDADGYVLGSFCVIDGRPRRWTEEELGLLQDLAELVMTELSLRNENRERRATERLLFTRNAELEQIAGEARAQAQKSAEFLASMSHEIRTPMNAVVGMTELLRKTPLLAAQARYVDTIQTSGRALLALINDILDFSKIESGRLELEAEPVNLRAALGEALELVAQPAQAKGLELGSTVDPELPATVLGDPVRLRQVLLNLLGNAVKFTARGQVHVGVFALPPPAGAAPDDDTLRLRFAVRDTGIGIPPDRQDRLFKSFSQVDSSTTRQYGGTGLGLAICARLVELMSGRIWVESTPGHGSTFYFEITVRRAAECAESGLSETPCGPNGAAASGAASAAVSADIAPSVAAFPEPSTSSPVASVSATAAAVAAYAPSAAVTAPPPSASESSAAEAKAGAPALRLLLAEDIPVNQEVALLLLENLGQSADVAANGLEVIEALQRASYDVVFLDVQMPEMDGLACARRIRALFPPAKRPWLIAMTANALDGDRETCLGAGMDDYISKPISGESLAAALGRAAIALGRGAPPARKAEAAGAAG